ncbi:hypothetical protein V1511DRAFT_405170 [Dipodascopsis uninucleata]
MYCLRYFLLLLVTPTTGLAPYYLALFLMSLFVIHRPCIYCSLILVGLFSCTCYFNEHCFIDTNYGNIFLPRLFLPEELASNSSLVYDILTERSVFSSAWLKRAVTAANMTYPPSLNDIATINAARDYKVPFMAVKLRF